MITCVITYDIDPFKRAKFEAYGRMWNEIIPRLGVDLIGYFAPHEGSLTTGYGIYTCATLADYEVYKTKLKTDDRAQAALAYAANEGFIRYEDRIFLKKVT
ncbi:MAG: NIPSNAP family protein [Ponticaulis sp.]|nr:NIPSNAP family protein [Ponticaulis sp.]